MSSRADSRTPVFILSGLLSDAEVWTEVIPLLEPIAQVTHLNFPSIASIGDMAERVLANAPERFAIVGHSMGGRVALEVARRAPNRITGLALLNTGVHPTRDEEPASRGRLVDLAQREGMSALAAEWLPGMLSKARPVSDPVWQRLSQMVERNTAASYAAQIQALLNRPEARETLPTIEVPVLLMSGIHDTWSPPKQHAQMRDEFPNAWLKVVEDAGHMTPTEAPRAVSQALAGWIRRVSEWTEGQAMDPLARREIRDSCERLILRAARYTDLQAWSPLADLYVPDATYYRPSDPDTPLRGRDDILTSLRARASRTTRHTVSNIEVFVESRDRASAVSSIVLYVAGTEEDGATIGSTAVGTFQDRFVRYGRNWLFEERRGAIQLRNK